MPYKLPRHEANPFQSPVKPVKLSVPSTTTSDTRTRQPDVLATADLLLEQLKELEDLCSTVEERVQRKRQALKELEYLISGLDTNDASPYSPTCPANTPVNSRLRLVSPRLRGLFDLHGPGQANIDATQSCLDYSPDTRVEDGLSANEDPGHTEEWVDDDDDEEEALLSPFDDMYALEPSMPKVEKDLPAVPHEATSRILESKIPRKAHVQRQVSACRKTTGRSLTAVTRSISRGRRSIVKPAIAPPDVTTKGTMRRGSWKRSIENAKKKGGVKGSSANENEAAKDNARKKEKRKGLWSIYSVCSELGLSGTHYYHAI